MFTIILKCPVLDCLSVLWTAVFEQNCAVGSCTVTVVSQHIRAKLTSGFCRRRELDGETRARMDLCQVSTAS